MRPNYGIVSRHTMARVLPTAERANGTPDEWYVEGLQTGSVDVASPVAILHESKEKDWYFVRSETLFGWVQAVDIAVGPPEDIRAYCTADNFIVALGHTVPVYSSNTFTSFIMDLYLGSRLNLVEKSARGYQVRLPVRKPDGSMEIIDGWIKPDAKVSVGYQPFTQRNVINTLFGLLYRPYSWNDAENEWNCCGFVRACHRTFGIKTGSWPAFQMHYSDHTTVFPAKTPRDVKYSYLDGCEPGITLIGGDGHTTVYLGKVDGRYYVIHMGGYDYKTEDGTVMMYRRVNVNETELVGDYNVDDWTKITTLKP